MTNREFFMARWNAERNAFSKVLKALPEDKGDWRPHPRSRSAAEIAALLAGEPAAMLALVKRGTLEWQDPPVATLAASSAQLDRSYKAVAAALKKVTDAGWRKKTTFTMGGKVVWEGPLSEMLWGFLFDAIHHRGQLSTYIRPMGGKVPAIYGPSADDPGR